MNVTKFLNENVKPATGCTEPIAVAYASSLAYHALYNDIPPEFNSNNPTPLIKNLERITVKTDRDVYKNAAAIIVPNSNGQKGIPIAAAMGIYCNPSKELNLLEELNQSVVEKANTLLKKNKVKVEEPIRNEEESPLIIQVQIKYKVENEMKTSFAELKYRHNNISQIKLNGETLYEQEFTPENKDDVELPDTIEELIEIAKNISKEERNEILKGIKMNKKISEKGLNSDHGLRVGKTLQKLLKEGELSNSLENKVKITATAAADARMGGVSKPVMTSSGSGNQGITATLPIKVVAEEKDIDQKRLTEAVMLSHLVTNYVSKRTEHLSAICGAASKAGIGATAGITYLLGGGNTEINNAINLMAANITGMICDGAKTGCALKISTATTQAFESALLANENIEVPKDNGIVHKKAEDTIKAIGKISKAMTQTDKSIIEIIKQK